MLQSVCLSVCHMPLGQKRYILGVWLLYNINKKVKLMLEDKPTSQRGSMTIGSG